MKKKNKGITLIALVVTIVILIILATISINTILGKNGVINRSEKAKLEYEISKAREELTLTLASAGLEKKLNHKYNQEDFLDDFILKEMPGTKIIGDVVIVNGHGFEIDRSVPKIGRYVGQEEMLIFPKVELSVTVAEDKKMATITIKAKEEKSGINKIQVIQEGHVIKEYPYEKMKEEIVEEYEAKQNGTYTIKVYGELTATERVKIEDLVMSVGFTPNGSEEYKREHEVMIKAEESVDKVKSIKYQWLNTTEEPKEETFTEECKNGETIKKNKVNETWYLWILLETEAGAKKIERSEGFNFDNEGPNVTLTSKPVSETSFTLTAEATDSHSGISKYEFYVDGKLEDTQKNSSTKASFNWQGNEMAEKECYVVVTDSLGNETKQTIIGKTKLYTWERWNCSRKTVNKIVDDTPVAVTFDTSIQDNYYYKVCTPDYENGTFDLTDRNCLG